MKRTFIYAMMSAIALAGAVGITSCAETEDVAEVNPGYNPETGEVPVNFVFNVSTGNTAVTRMSKDVVQATSDEAFRGMDQTALMSFRLASDAKHVASSTDGSDAVIAHKQYALGSVLGSNAISSTESRRLLELAVPTGTNTFMFWGKAAKTEGKDKEQGKIDFKADVDLTQSSFKLCPILPTGDKRTEFSQYQKLIAAAINIIMASSYTGPADHGSEHIDVTDLRWSDYAQLVTSAGENPVTTLEEKIVNPQQTGGMSALGEILANAFVTFNTISANELRAGSGPAVEKMLVDLYTVINKVASATPTDLPEAVAKRVGQSVRTNMEKFLNASKLFACWAKLENVKSNSGLAAADMTLLAGTNDDEDIELKKFPSKFGMPDGSTVLKCEITAEAGEATRVKSVVYSYRQNIPAYDMGGTTVLPDGFDIYNYMYPAELCYFGNSPARVSDGTHTTTKDIFPQGTSNWDDDTKWLADADGKTWTKSSHVESSTRSVGMQENINYGSSLLKASVRYGYGELEDNNHALHPSEENRKITVTANTLTWKGMLVGGQYQEMGWNYVAKDGSATNVMIYDGSVPNGAIPAYTDGAGLSAPNYTLVWDNWNASKKGSRQQNVVYVALEFVNNGDAFWGQNNLIPAGGTFYITAMLDPNTSEDLSASITWPLATGEDKVEGRSYYALPPYDADGSTIKERRVFIQDYMTEATFVIGRQSLQKALVAVPDLRSAEMTLGLSVDLKWSTGINFNEVILGGDGMNTLPTP